MTTRPNAGVSRRGFLGATLGGSALISPAFATDPGQPRPASSVDALGLDPASLADLEAFAAPVLREAARLHELPLDGVMPAFRFLPDGRDE